MTLHTLEQAQTLPITIDEAWRFFSSPRNLDEITPADLGFEIRYVAGGRVYDGQIITYRVRIAPGIRVSWVTEIKAVDEGRSFIDEQRFGPYKFWHHKHLFEAVDGGVRMTDLVHYALPLGPLGGIAHAVFVRRKLENIFAHRKKILSAKFGGDDF
jgi:ligand-binding SRPBCC domain-containing protein